MLTNVTGSRKVHTVWPLHLWVAIGLFGAFGLALVGTSLGALPRPDMPSWWFNVSMGNAAITHIAFYLSIALMLVGWGGVGLHAYAGRLSVPKAWCILAMWGTSASISDLRCSVEISTATSARASWPDTVSTRTSCLPHTWAMA